MVFDATGSAQIFSNVSFIGDNRLTVSTEHDISILNITSGEWLHQVNLCDAHFPTCCAKLPNLDWVVVACVEETDQHDGCLYKVQIEAPYMVELICEDMLVEDLFLE